MKLIIYNNIMFYLVIECILHYKKTKEIFQKKIKTNEIPWKDAGTISFQNKENKNLNLNIPLSPSKKDYFYMPEQCLYFYRYEQEFNNEKDFLIFKKIFSQTNWIKI